MANIQAPFGFRPALRYDGVALNFAAKRYLIASNNSSVICRGDPVKLLSTGFVDVLAPGTTAVLGIFWGCEYQDSVFQRSVWLPSWQAPTTVVSGSQPICWVFDDPNMIFEVQSGNSASTATAITQGNVGNNIQFAGQSTPNTAGYSQAYADQNTLTTTSTLPFRIWDLGNRIGNDNTSAFNTILVKPNFSQLNNTTGV